jgi:hypothetical protein
MDSRDEGGPCASFYGKLRCHDPASLGARAPLLPRALRARRRTCCGAGLAGQAVHIVVPFSTTGFLAVAVPRAVPDDMKRKLNALINEAIFSPDINKRLVEEFALTPRRLDLAQCAEEDRAERAKWAEYVRIARIEPQ